jgi:2-polyprenyl-6-methoxyphenol hydroxylase-like FAD-dependent oxidoreductase
LGGFFFVVSFGTHFNEELAQDGKLIKGSVYRVGSPVPVESGEPPYAPPKEYVQNLINTYGPTCMSSDPSVNPTPVNVDQLVWSSRFRTHSAIADRTFARLGAAILLVGDAAHIHSPMGGQGMNLAIRDAIFLGDAVTEHIRVSAENPDVDDTILREFAEARRARGLETINYTKGLNKFASLSYDTYWWMPFSLASVRDLGLWILGKFEFTQFMYAWSVSGLGRR